MLVEILIPWNSGTMVSEYSGGDVDIGGYMVVSKDPGLGFGMLPEGFYR